MQLYTAVPKNIRRQAKMLYVLCPENRKDWDVIHEEHYVIKTPEELENVNKRLEEGKHTCLIMRKEIRKLTKFIEFCNKTFTRLLSEITALLTRDS